MARLFCIRHKRIVNAYCKDMYDKKYKGKDLFSRNCGCTFSREYLEKYRVHNKVIYFLKDGTEIRKTNPKTEIQYEMITK